MTNDHNDLVLDVLAQLRAFARERTTPHDAEDRMRSGIAHHPGARVELVSELDAYDDSFHFDAVIDEADGALSVRFCPDRGQPFILRGAERLGDRDLVRVDGQVLLIRDAVALLDFVWNQRPLMKRLIDVCIIEATLANDPVDVTDGDVQDALDRLRAANGLHNAAETLHWMTQRGMTHEMFERHATDQAAIIALRERIVGTRVTDHFAAHRNDYDVATFVQLGFSDDEHALGIVDEVAATGCDIFAAIATWLERAPANAQPVPSIATRLRRDMSAPFREAIFDRDATRPRRVRDGGALLLVQVLATRRAELDHATRDRIADELFEAWLAERRATAMIEWNWGHVSRTQLG